jgi:hypothetical protein
VDARVGEVEFVKWQVQEQSFSDLSRDVAVIGSGMAEEASKDWNSEFD